MKDSEAENHLGYMREPANQRKQKSKEVNTRYEQSICKNLICNQYLHNIQLRRN